MADLFMMVPAKTHAAHAAQTAINTIPEHIPSLIGVSYMTAIIAAGVALLVGAGLGWYVKGRGMAGVQIDLNNVKTDVENLKAKVSGTQAPATPAVAA
jgi:hypothetical protein